MAVPSSYPRSLNTKDKCAKPARNILTLPLEIVHIITHHLSPADIACLALCNHFLLFVLGKQTLSMPQQNGDLASFLNTLTRDLSAHFFCHECSHLHSRDQIGPPGPALQPRNRLRCIAGPKGLELRSYFHPWGGFSGYMLTFPHVQVAMKRYRHGIDHGVSTQSLSFVEVHVSDKAQKLGQMTTLLSVEARVCPGSSSLCLRIQQWAFLRSTDLEELLTASVFLTICDHLGELTSDISRLVRSEIGPRRTDTKDPISTGVHKCRQCNTDFQVEIRMVADEGLGLIITKWIDLGSGLNPMDIERRFCCEIPRRKASGVPGDLRLRFESEPNLSRDELSSRNETYLVGERFRKVLDRWDSKTWVLQAGRRMTLFELVREGKVPDLWILALALLLYMFADWIYWWSH